MTISTVKHPGEFAITSGSMTVTDPCYTPDTWCIHKLPATNGLWRLEVGYMRDESDLHWPHKRLAEAPAERQRLQQVMEAADAKSNERFTASWHLTDLEETCKRAQIAIDTYKGRIAYIRAWHIDTHGQVMPPITPEALNSSAFERIDEADIGVDSGQAGFIDSESFAEVTKGGTRDNPAWKVWYRAICSHTSSEAPGANFVAVLSKAAFSHSGYGDGSYELFAKRSTDGATDVVVNFMMDLGD